MKKLQDEVLYILVIHLEASIIFVMVDTRRSGSQGARRNPANSSPPPSNSPSIEQALMTQTQLLQTIAQNVLNNSHQAPPTNKRSEFMKGHPPTFSHTSKPLEADDWLRAVERQLDIAQCDDHEKVLYAFGQLQGTAQDWWDSFEYGHPNNAPTITWQEFKENFRSYHISLIEVELKQD